MNRNETTSKQPVYVKLPVVIMLCGAVCLFIFITNINPARANSATLDLLRRSAQIGDPTSLYDTVLRYPTPHIDDVRNDIARSVMTYVQNINARSKPSADALLIRSIGDIKKNIALHPRDVRLYLLLADLERTRESVVRDGTSVGAALVALNQALVISPRRQQILFVTAATYQAVGDNQRALALLQQARDLDPQISEGWGRLAQFYIFLGDKERAFAILVA